MNATEIQRDSWEMSCVKAEAQRYCDRCEITDENSYRSVVHSLAHRRFMEASEPLREMRARILYMHVAIHPVMLIMHEGGRVENVPAPLSSMQKESLRLLDAAIADEAQKWGFKTVEVNSDSKDSESDSNAMRMIALEPI